ncbi:TetR/AcrR family transcriptional regulator [Nocardia brasiliensis]
MAAKHTSDSTPTPRTRRHRASGAARRDALLGATVEVVAAQGMAGVTHRSVTEQAGVPLATISYFFESIGDLAEEALRVFAAERVTALSALNETLATHELDFDRMAALFAASAASNRTQSMAMFEAFLDAGRRVEHRSTVAAALAALRQVATTALATAGASEPEKAAESYAALVDGFALHALTRENQEVDRAGLHRAIRAMYLGELVEAGRIEEAVRLSAAGPE